MLRLRLTAMILAVAGLAPLTVAAQDYGWDQGPDDGADYAAAARPSPYDRAYNDDDYARQGDARDNSGVPYAGRYLGYDYVTNRYYRWDSLPPQDHRAREQDGWRDGRVHTRPVRYYGWRRYDLCGCGRYSYYRINNWRGRHAYVQLDPRQRDYTPSYAYSPQSYYRSWITRRSDFPW
ncbi:MAG TPA: hypothetical protein VN042_06280 [Asticcacaulis sp.]|nr:hypothetical protein [Asticcacaulis sp.]